MTDATKLLLDLLAVIPDGEKVAAFFAEDGVVETVAQKLFRRRNNDGCQPTVSKRSANRFR